MVNRVKFPKMPPMTQEEMADFEDALREADGLAEVRPLIEGKFGINKSHLSFLSKIGGAAKLREFYYEVIKFDLLYGTNTTAYISEAVYKRIAEQDPSRLATPEHAEHGVKHRSSLTSVIKSSFDEAVNILRKYGYGPEDASLFDLGSGQGKAILMGMSTLDGFSYSFKRAVGVDYFQDVIEEAQQNIEIGRKSLQLPYDLDVSFVFEDASDYTDYNGVNVVYTYNSFDESIMRRVEKNLRKFANGSTIFIYNKPLHKHLFLEEKGWKKEQEIIANKDPDKQLAIFSRGFDND